MLLPAALLALYNTSAYDGAGYIALETLSFGDRSLRLDCRADTHEPYDDPAPLPLRVTFEGVIDWRLSANQWETFEEPHDHPALIPYRYPRSELYLKSAPRDIPAAFAETIAALQTARLGQDDPLRTFGFTATGYLTRLGQGFGRLTEGPTPYVDALAAVLRRHGAGPSSLSLKPLRRHVYYAEHGTYGSEPYDQERLTVVVFGENWVLLEGEAAVALRTA